MSLLALVGGRGLLIGCDNRWTSWGKVKRVSSTRLTPNNSTASTVVARVDQVTFIPLLNCYQPQFFQMLNQSGDLYPAFLLPNYICLS
jgi:hypothetical protein